MDGAGGGGSAKGIVLAALMRGVHCRETEPRSDEERLLHREREPHSEEERPDHCTCWLVHELSDWMGEEGKGC